MDARAELSRDSGRTVRIFPDRAADHQLAPADDPQALSCTDLEKFQLLINALPEQIALVDDKWIILAVNEAWTSTAGLYGYDGLVPGCNYLEFCEAKGREGHKPAALVANGIRMMQARDERSARYVYHGREGWEDHAYHLCVRRMEIDGRNYGTITRYDVTELVHLRELREGFGLTLIEGQDQERRRLAREIHDSTMQLLAGLGLSLGQLRRSDPSQATAEIIGEMEELLGEAQRELRAIAYLAHPPQLHEMGLAKAAKQLADGFGRRTGMAIEVDTGEDLQLTSAAQVAVYRVVQEALSNIHRHAAATQAHVSFHQRPGVAHVAVADNGVGMPRTLLEGVGMSSMRERLGEVGGRLTVRQGDPGTILIASIPDHAELRRVGDLDLQAAEASAA